ncbi:MAG TPA: DNA topoisomerase VI subunit B, partial [Candidatus Scalindua sp.]|nr:DNA topoisomerase VI subunit B [Candidatus Scalindua sp.]
MATSKKRKKLTETEHKATAHDLAKKQREISVSEFFTKNRHLLGFDNPRKALLTTIKEGIDNSLDACEEVKILPDIKVRINQVKNTEDRFRVTIEDNGPGILKSQIPKIFGKLLYGSKFHRLKMSRGQQGIGISAAGMYGQLTTGKPILITSKISPKKPAHHYSLVVDTQKNEPRIIKDEIVDYDSKRGTKVVIELEARYQKGRQSVDGYIEQTSIANPHTDITYINPEDKETRYPRASKELPADPKEIKPHPYGIELGILIKMLHDTNAKNLRSCLTNDFSRVSTKVANEICEKAGL